MIPDLFSQPSEAQRLAQAGIEDARKERDRIIPAVENKAGEEFNTLARAFVIEYLRAYGPTSGEDLTDAVKSAGIVPPNGDRAFGGIYMSLSRSGLIVKDHTRSAPRRKGHLSGNVNFWKIAQANG